MLNAGRLIGVTTLDDKSAEGRDLFISRGTRYIVVDPDQGKIIGDIPDSQRAHGIAFANEFNKDSPPTAATPIPSCSISPRSKSSTESRRTRKGKKKLF
jgi:hypothetical protein